MGVPCVTAVRGLLQSSYMDVDCDKQINMKVNKQFTHKLINLKANNIIYSCNLEVR